MSIDTNTPAIQPQLTETPQVPERRRIGDVVREANADFEAATEQALDAGASNYEIVSHRDVGVRQDITENTAARLSSNPRDLLRKHGFNI